MVRQLTPNRWNWSQSDGKWVYIELTQGGNKKFFYQLKPPQEFIDLTYKIKVLNDKLEDIGGPLLIQRNNSPLFIVFANEEEAGAFTGLAPDQALSYFSELCEIAVVKIGAEGSLLKKDEEIVRISALPVRCNDTTGAGDLYASGFLYGYANGMNLQQCGQIGSLLAGKVIEVVGARMEKKIFKEIRRIIKDSIDSNQTG